MYINKNCILLLIGQSISQLGSSMTSFAVVIWAYSFTGKVLSSSLLAVCSFIPYLIVSFLGGTIADNVNKKKIMLICDTVAAICSFVILICSTLNILQIWILCIVNIINGFMNAFQNPASQVAISLMVEKEYYTKVGGIQSCVSACVGILNPLMAAGLLSWGGLTLVLLFDLVTFLFAFFTLLFIHIPDCVQENNLNMHSIINDMKDGIRFVIDEKSILFLLVMYCILEFIGAISFDSMYSPLLLARSNNNQNIVGIVSSMAAVGSMIASLIIMIKKQTKNKVFAMLAGSVLCLSGIMFFGMGQNLLAWCSAVLLGCFGTPIYQTYQTVILRENIPLNMQGRVFSLQGMITQSLSPLGFILGALLADNIFEPLMNHKSILRDIFAIFVGEGPGAGMGALFVISGFIGIILIIILGKNQYIKNLNKLQ